MNIHYLFEYHEGGLFSNFNKVITFLTHNKPSKITWNFKGQPFGAFAYNVDEVFSKLFKNIIINDQIDKTVIVKDFNYLQYTSVNVHKLYVDPDQSWRYTLHNTYTKYIHPVEAFKKQIQEIDKKFNNIKNTKVGILKRNQLLKCEQISNTMPTINEYFNHISNDSTLYLSVDNNTDLNLFQHNYDCIYNPFMKRSNADTDTEPHFTPGGIHDIYNNFLDVYALSKCDILIHPISNMSTAALYMNPTLKSIYLR